MNKDALEEAFDRAFTESGDNWKASCPMHDERTPSFYVHQTELIANCFGCGTTGYIDTLLAKYAGISPQKAREILGINIVEEVVNKARQRKKEPPKYYPESWLSPFKPRIHKYLLERFGNSDETIAIFRSTGTCYDSVKKRQVFPHRDKEGRLVGAVGRTTANLPPKWLFYWGYERGRTLYRPRSPRFDRAILVEGVLDIIRLMQAGMDKTYDLVAPIGANLGAGQIRELREYDDVVIAFDNDDDKDTNTGYESAARLNRTLKKSCRLSFVQLPLHINDIGETPVELIPDIIGTAQTYAQRYLTL